MKPIEMGKFESVKQVDAKLWFKRFQRCNPLDENDKEMKDALEVVMPKDGFVYRAIRGKKMSELGELNLQNWADGEAGKNKFPKIEIVARMAYVRRFLIPSLRAEGIDEEDIAEELRLLGFSGCTTHIV